MKRDWAYLTKITGGQPITIQRIMVDDSDIAIEGAFELPPLARLTAEDQVFVAVFVKSHGSIKQMEKHFGVSYPTIKGRLNRIAAQLDFVEVEAGGPDKADILDRLERGEINVNDALAELGGEESDE